ncbi:hypothetical protein C8R43DRAFT_1051924 [Mycena crocata]|nr:hypothetical protein C8R43DRAFT_1051924 [Mycena crocata]
MISFAMSEMIALMLEALAYGMYLILFFACLSVAFARRKEKRGFNSKFLATSLLLFVLITWHLITDAVMLFLAYNNETTLEADIYYSNIPGTLNVMKTGVYVCVTLISDAFMLYRCFVVWNRSLAIIALPLLLLAADIATGVAGLVVLKRSTTTFFTENQLRVTSAFFGLTMATNNVSTVLIAVRVWQGQRQMKGITTMSSLNKLVVVVLESGAMYSTMLVLVLGTFVGQSTAAFNILIDIVSPVIGIVFSLIIVRVGLNLSVNSDGRLPENTSSTLLFQTTSLSAPVRKVPKDHALELKLGTNAASTRTTVGTSMAGSEFDSIGTGHIKNTETTGDSL